MSFLVSNRKNDNVFHEDLWGKMIKNERNIYGQLFTLDYLYTKNFDDYYDYYTKHTATGNPIDWLGANPPRYLPDQFGKAQATADWEGGYTNNPYAYDNINYYNSEDLANMAVVPNSVVNRTLNVPTYKTIQPPPGFRLFSYTEDIGMYPTYVANTAFPAIRGVRSPTGKHRSIKRSRGGRGRGSPSITSVGGFGFPSSSVGL